MGTPYYFPPFLGRVAARLGQGRGVHDPIMAQVQTFFKAAPGATGLRLGDPASGLRPVACGLSCRSAPQGRRHGAAGGAQPAARRAECNPWERCVCGGPAPRGAEESPSPRRGEKKRIGKKERIGGPLSAHGFRVGPLRGRAAPPAATPPGPVGAEDAPANPQPARQARERVQNGLLRHSAVCNLHSAIVSAFLCVLYALRGEMRARDSSSGPISDRASPLWT
jgi:hypothetical protein